jgi:hypothetical protein
MGTADGSAGDRVVPAGLRAFEPTGDDRYRVVLTTGVAAITERSRES